MGNSNSSHRHRPHITDPLPMDPAAWSSQSTYPGNNFKGPPRPMMMQQQPHPSGGPDTVDGPRSMGVIRNGRSSSYDQFDQECMIQQQQSHPDARFARYLPPLGVVPQVEAAQPRKIRVLPTLNGAGNSGGINGDQGVPKLRPTDNGLALQKVGTLHVPANRKLTELQITKPTSPPVADESSSSSPPASTDDTRSPTPDYPESHNGKSNNRSSRPRSKKNQKAPVAPSTPALSAKSMEMGEQPSSQGKRGKLKLFKTKSDPKRSESDRMRARSMEYLRTDLADDMQEVRRRHSREDLSGDESILAVTKNGPVTVFSSQKKLDDDDWEEMPRINKTKKEKAETSPPKQFYFGMTPGDVAVATVPPPPPALDLDEESRRVMEEFDAVLSESRTKSEEDPLEIIAQPKIKSGNRRIIKQSPPPPPVYMDDDDDDDESQDIALNLRPTLPKKPQQLPRFSPSAAWRALGHQPDSIYSRKLDSSKASDMSAMDLSDEEDDEDVMEERINKNSRPVAPHPPRNINEKSADSGISGDAGSPDAGAMKPLAMSSPVPQQQQQNWTPQQDLIDDSSSSDADVTPEPKIMVKRNTSSGAGMIPAPKIIPKSQMFNDSTDTPGSSVSGRQGNSNNSRGRKYRKRSENQPEAPQKYNSLRKLKRSVSGAFATAFRRGSKDSPEESSSLDDGNWVLSRSAPNSVVNGSVGESSLRKLHRSEADLLHQAQLQAQSMALPGMLIHQYPAYSQPVLTQRIVYLPQYDSRPNRHSGNQRYSRMPEQAEMMRRAKSADALYLESQKQQQGLMRRISNPGKKFTFQSTVRVQEKRALEQRLSREAELKERKRLQEVQAMQRVEEEFQRKRAREKANIRQQLRILQYSSEQDPNSARLDPEGAPSSISHNRTSSDEIQQAKISAAVRSPPAEHKRSNAAVILMAGRRTTPPEEQHRKIHQDYRREAVISSSRTRSAAPPPPPSFQTHPERNNNNNNNPPVKKPSNIYKRLAEIASEEESICSPPPVPNVVVKASPSRGNPGGGHYQMNGGGGGRRNNPPPPPQAVNGPNNSSNNNNKVMTQELSEFRQERREYRDYRSPRQHITTQPGRYGPSSSGQARSGPTSSASSSSINHSGGSNKMQSDNYRWEFAHGGRAVGGGRTTYVAPPPVPVWHHHHHGPPTHQVVRHHHDYFYKIPPPGEVVMMHRTPQQHRHH